MRILQLHSDFIEYKPIKKEIAIAEECEKKKNRLDEVVVLFTAVEKGDDEQVARMAIDEVKSSLKKIKANRILIYPYAHLSNNLARPVDALKVVKEMEGYVKKLGIETHRTPFGWTKIFNIKIKGHPLAEQLKLILPGKKVKTEARPRIKKFYLILTPDGKVHQPEKHRFKKGEEEFKVLVEKEALGVESRTKGEPKYIKHMKKFGFDWEAMSDLGHMKFGPEASLIFDLIAEYSSQLTKFLGIPVYPLKGSNIFRLDEKAIAEHANLFPERMYKFEMENRDFILRYAACFQQFAIIKDWQISYKHLPFGAFEVADSYRFEQSGELLLSFRLRKMAMPDFHTFCKDLEEAKEYFLKLHKIIYQEIKNLGRDYVSLYNLTSREFFEKNKKWFLELVKYEKKPVLLCFYPKGVEYYWVLNVEYHIIDDMNRPREIATIQIDVGNAKRFGIKYVDKDGKENYPIILHTAILGTIERWLYTLFDTALKMKNPALPLWLSPTQVRVIPLSDKYMKYSQKIAEQIEKNQIRVDIDDRIETVPKKIRGAELEWIPFSLVIGEKEIKSKKLAVRIRKSGKIKQMKLEDLIKLVKKETEGKPFKCLPLPKLLSKRPIFVG
ncbi:MAG: threonine--tRNA ligase [Candidatus Aenigmarchaeota archaeon]|nr:threonine--tRNA ligase [Candidatus Aenigmarchaeota archaeon]